MTHDDSEHEEGLGGAPATIHRTEIDGVPTFWVEDTGPCWAGLLFRVGQADESATEHGITHLVEHLTMAAVGQQPYQLNATVDTTTTMFTARGAPQEIAAFLSSVCKGLGNLPLDRLKLEARVLRTEEQGRGAGVVPHLLWLRYGYTTFGLAWMPEIGLNDPQPARVQEWASSRFNRGNCVLWVVGRLPKGLSLPLPDGPRFPLVDPTPIRELVFPAAMSAGEGGVAIGLEGPRTSTSTTIFRIALNRLHTQVRLDKGLTYEIGYSRDPLTAARAHNAIWLTCLQDQASAVRLELMQTLDGMAKQGPTQQELDEDMAAFLRHGSDPDSRIQDVASTAQYELVGMPAVGYAGLIEERRVVTAEGCAAELRQMLDTAILVSPADSGNPPARFKPYPIYSTHAVAGRTFKNAKDKPWQKSERLVIGPEGISILSKDDLAVTVRWSECVALLGEKNQARVVIGADGFTVRVAPDRWRDGGAALALIESSVPPALRVPAEE